MEQSPRPPSPHTTTASPTPLATELSGDLPCIVCRYNLRGLSILSTCPECGTRIRATILARVDPHAAVFRPLRRPKLLAAAIVLWPAGALLAAVINWTPQAGAAIAALRGRAAPEPDVRVWLMVAVGVSWLGALGLAAPQRPTPGRHTLLALAGAAAYVPLALALWKVATIKSVGETGVIGPWPPLPERTMWRIVAGVMVAVIALCLRPSARLLVARSLVLRTGRVDRQTLLALAAAAAVWVIGDVLSLAVRDESGLVAQVGHVLAVVMIATGSLLVTLGVAGAVVDSVRIAWSIVRPAPSLEALLANPQRAVTSQEGRETGHAGEGGA